MYKVIEWSPDLDLTEFYAEAQRRGFVNNSSKKAMIDCFNNESKSKVWILYQDERAIGSVAAHSFDDVMGLNSYRILTRVCTFAEARPKKGLITANRLISEHQNLTDQFLLPACIRWAGTENIYSTSTSQDVASQRMVHRIYFPTLERKGLVTCLGKINYRHTDQTLWKINGQAFLDDLERYPRWI